MPSSDPFSSSVIPFEVPEQVRAFAEKGVSQARDTYAKFKDAAETHNGTIEAVFSTFSKGASEYSAKLMEMMKTATTANLDFAQELIGVKSPSEAMELWSSHARKQFEVLYRPWQGAHRAGPEGCDRSRRADQGQCLEAVQAGRLIASSPALFVLNKPARTANPGFFVGAFRPRRKPGWPGTAARNDVDAAISRSSPGLAKAGRCT